MPSVDGSPRNAGTGVAGLDIILQGGFPRERIVLVWGGPGTGKTTLSLQFLREGVRHGERVLYAPLLQTKPELEEIMGSHDWTLDGIHIAELPENIRKGSHANQTLFSPGDIELHEVAEGILEAIRTHKPERMVLDSISELSILVEHSYQFHRQLLKIKEELSRHGCTTIFTAGAVATDMQEVQTMVHGVIKLTQEAQSYGPPRRRLEVTKMRARVFRGGCHDLAIRRGGIEVYPGLDYSPTKPSTTTPHLVASGNHALDKLLGGGLEEGTACMLLGPAGTGKSTLASLYVQAAAERSTRSAVFCFDERQDMFFRRSDSLGLRLRQLTAAGMIDLQDVNVGEISPGGFMDALSRKVHDEGVRVVVIDSITGYFNALPDDRLQQHRQLHELLNYLSRRNVLTIMVVSTHGFLEEQRHFVDVSYLADVVVLLRHFEAAGSVRKCVSVVKKRHGQHESTIREIQFKTGGMEVGEPLRQFSGVLTGQPTFIGRHDALIDSADAHPSQGLIDAGR